MSPLVRRSCCPVASSKLIVQEAPSVVCTLELCLLSLQRRGVGFQGALHSPCPWAHSSRPRITVASALAAEKSSRGPLLSWPS